jgi:uncharacterized protein YhhL (DUF1145 family)
MWWKLGILVVVAGVAALVLFTPFPRPLRFTIKIPPARPPAAARQSSN